MSIAAGALTSGRPDDAFGVSAVVADDGPEEALLKTLALQRAVFNSSSFSSIATDASGAIQIFNVGAERMLGYAASDVLNRITPADISDPAELVARARELSLEMSTPIAPGFEAPAFKASRGIEDIYPGAPGFAACSADGHVVSLLPASP